MKTLFLLLSVVLLLTAGAWCQSTGSLTASSTDCSVSTACLVVPLSVATSAPTGSISITIAGTFSATVQFEASGDNKATWAALNCYPTNSTSGATSTTAVGLFQCNAAAYTNFRLRVSAYTSGTVAVTVQPSTATASSGRGGGGGASFVSGAIQFATSTTAARATTVTDVVNLWTACGSNFLKGDGTCAAAGGGGGGVAFQLLVAVCQLTAGKSLNGSFPAANAPTPDCVSGSTTAPQSGRALFSQISLAATPNQWVDQQFILPNPLTGTYSLVIKIQNDVVTAGTDYVSFQYVCVSDGSGALPAYSSVQSFSVAVPTGAANTYATITGTPTVLGCSAGNVFYTRLGVVTGSGSPTTNNLAIHSATLFVK